MAGRLSKRAGSLWTWLGASKDQIAILFALVAGLTTLYQYLEGKEHERRAETIEFIKRYYSDSHLAMRASLNSVLLDKGKQQLYLKIIGGKDNEADLLKFIESNQMVKPIMTLVEFYDSLAVCVLTKGCDQEVACSYFAEEINGHYHNYSRLFADTWKKMWGQNFMQRAYDFAQACPQKK